MRHPALLLALTLFACTDKSSDGQAVGDDGAGGHDGGLIDAGHDPRIDAGNAAIDAGDIIARPDASFDQPDATLSTACDPVLQLGCAAGEKCAWLTVSDAPSLGKTTCVPDGPVAIDGACTPGIPGEATGYDDCAAGGSCQDGTCHAICGTSPDTCDADHACTSFFQLFDDLPASVGLCAPTCDPVGQDLAGWADCPADDGCYLSAATGKGLCANVPAEAVGLDQGDACYGPAADSCYLNGCDRGYQALLLASPGGADSVCGAFCTPADSFMGHAGNKQGTGAAKCTVARIGVAGQACRFIQSIYGADTGAAIPASYGTCAPEAVWGSCSDFNPLGMVAAYNAGYLGATQPERAAAAGAALCTYCGLSSDCSTGDMLPRCQNVGCVSLAKQAELDAMYLTN